MKSKKSEYIDKGKSLEHRVRWLRVNSAIAGITLPLAIESFSEGEYIRGIMISTLTIYNAIQAYHRARGIVSNYKKR